MIRSILASFAFVTLLASTGQATLTCADLFGRSKSFATQLAEKHAFDAQAFEDKWRSLTDRFKDRNDVLITEWSDQTPLDAKILEFRLRTPGSNPLRVLITGGVHGNEPLGTLAALDIIDTLSLQANGRALDITVMPALNYEGLVENHRTNNGIDLNRSFAKTPSAKIRRIKEAIGRRKFDLALDLHGSNERRQFFVIKQGDDQGLAARAIQILPPELRLKSDAGSDTGPVGLQTSKGYEKGRYNLEAAGLATSINVGTLKSYMSDHGTTNTYTLEYPGELDFKSARGNFLKLALNFLKEAN